jgi:ribosomal protein S18 acetylase RimI-like enzyme
MKRPIAECLDNGAGTAVEIHQVLVEDARPFWEVIDSVAFPSADRFVQGLYENPFVIQRRLATGNDLFYRLKCGEEYVGAADMVKRAEPGAASISIIAVKESDRRRGFGAILLKHCIATARSLNFRRLYANVPARNTPALILFTKHYFVPEALWRDLYADGVDVVSFTLNLNQSPDFS